MLRAAILLAVLAQSPAAFAQSAADTGHREIKRVLESVRAPIYVGTAVAPGVSSTYSVTSAGCRSDFQIFVPPLSSDGKAYPSHVETPSIDWSKTSEITTWSSYALVKGSGLAEAGQYLYAGSDTAALALRDHMRAIAISCGGKTGAAPPTPAPAASPAYSFNREVERARATIDALLDPHVEGLETRFGYVPDLFTYDSVTKGCVTGVVRVQRRITSGRNYIRGEMRDWRIEWGSVRAVQGARVSNSHDNPNGVLVTLADGSTFLVGLKSDDDKFNLMYAMETLRAACE